MSTLYDTLGVREDASEDEIKRAYRKAAMKWHPDRNVGQEDASRAAFQEIKNAYAILSDAAQRAVYDAVFAEEMRRWENQRQQEEQERAEREAAAQAAAQAIYTEMVALAMRFADEGYNRDVVFGVLLGNQCEVQLANQIADSVRALHESRQADAAPGAAEEAQEQEAESDEPSEDRGAAHAQSESQHGRRHAGVFDSLWHGFFGIRS